MQKKRIGSEEFIKAACMTLDKCHDAIDSGRRQGEIGRMIRSLMDAHMMSTAELDTMLNRLNEFKEDESIPQEDIIAALDAISGLKDLCQQKGSSLDYTYPREHGAVNTQAFSIWHEANEDQMRKGSQLIFKDLNRDVKLLGQSHTNFLVSDNGDDQLTQLMPIVFDVDFVCGIDPSILKSTYDEAIALQDLIETYDWSSSKNQQRGKHELNTLIISALLDHPDKLKSLEQAHQQLIADHGINPSHSQDIKKLLQLRDNFESEHPDLGAIRMFAINGAGQHICNDLYLLSTMGNRDHNVAPTITIDGNPIFMQGRNAQNLSRHGHVQFVDTDDEDLIFTHLTTALPGTYLVVKSDNEPWSIYYNHSGTNISTVKIQDVPDFMSLTALQGAQSANELSDKQKYRIEQCLGRYHETMRFPEGKTVVQMKFTADKFIHNTDFYCVDPKTGVLIGPLDPEIGSTYPGKDNACVFELEVSVNATPDGKIKPCISFESFQSVTNALGHVHQKATAATLDNQSEQINDSKQSKM